jgi:hypothetical protein
MAIILVTASAVKPLEGSIIRRGTAGASGTVGQLVTLQSDGKWDPSSSTTSGMAQARGLVVAVNGQAGAASFADGDRIDIVRYGAAAYGASMTPGAAVYVTVSGGADQTAPTTGVVFKVGYAEAANILFIDPQDGPPVAA